MEAKEAELIKTSIKLVDDKLKFEASNGENDPIIVNYPPPLGHERGYNSLEVFQISLGTCIGSVFVNLLRKMKKEIKAFDIEVSGEKNNQHPKSFTKIQITMKLTSPNTSEAEMHKTMDLAENYCAVKAMLKESIEIVHKFELNI